MGNFFQRQAMAVPADINDPLLKKWIKPTTNPFLVQVRSKTLGKASKRCHMLWRMTLHHVHIIIAVMKLSDF